MCGVLFCITEANDDYVTRSYENHGFVRDYVARVDGDTWTFNGDTERTGIEFAYGGDTRKIAWEWRKPGEAEKWRADMTNSDSETSILAIIEARWRSREASGEVCTVD